MSGSGRKEYGGQSMVAPLRWVLVRRPGWSLQAVSREAAWQSWGYSAKPELDRARREHEQYTELLQHAGAKVSYVSGAEPALCDAVFTYDTALITDQGAVLLNPGKPPRRPEVAAVERTLEQEKVPIIAQLRSPATAEGGDMLWLDRRTLLVGRSYRTNSKGIELLRELLAPHGVDVVVVPIVHWHGPGEVMHLMSLLSPVDTKLVVVYPKLIAVEAMELLQNRGIELIEVPDDEFLTLGCNVLAVAPQKCIMARGNPRVREALEHRGVEVWDYPARELGLNMGGGPTCMALPLLRAE